MRINQPLSKSFWMFWILLIGFALRVCHLDLKPVHFDEGINGHFVETIWHDGFYRYDPTNFHGPLYFYLLAAAERIFGFGIFGFRFVTAILQLALIYVVGLHRRFVGRSAIWAALIVALEPGVRFLFALRDSRKPVHSFSSRFFVRLLFCTAKEKSMTSIWWMTSRHRRARDHQRNILHFSRHVGHRGCGFINLIRSSFCRVSRNLEIESGLETSASANHLDRGRACRPDGHLGVIHGRLSVSAWRA